MSVQLKYIVLICAVLTSSCNRMDEQVIVPPAKTDSAGVYVFKGQPISSTTDVVTVAGQLLKARGLAWGDPLEFLWQEDHARHLVLYATPEKEMMEIGGRGVFVMTNGNAIVMPQL